MRLVLVASVVFLLTSHAATAQVVHRDEIADFSGILGVERTGAKWDDWTLVNSGFVSWSNETEFWSMGSWRTYRKKFANQFIGSVGSSSFGPRAIPGTDLVVVPLNDKFGHERQFRALTFWECEGDSLHMRQIMPKVFVGGLGALRVVGAIAGRNESAVVVVENYSGGEGDHRGVYEFFLLNTETLQSELLYTDSFYYEYAARCDTLSFQLFENDHGVQAELYREQVDYELGEAAPHNWARVSVSVDTTYVQLVQ